MTRLRGWKNLAPYKWRLLLLATLSCAEVVLRVLLPWPMKVVVDHALGAISPPRWITAIAGTRRQSILAFAVLASVVLQMAHQLVLMAHTRVYTFTGHLLTNDLRQRLFVHLQSLSLRQHSKLPVGEAAYRLQADAGFLDQLIIRGILPLIFSAATLVVMFAILMRMDRLLALVALLIVPPLFAWIRWYTTRLRPTADRTHAIESRLSARLHESFSAIRLVKSFAREPYEGYRFAGAAADAMQARVALSSREAWFSLIVGDLIVLGTAAVVFTGGVQVIRGTLTVGNLLLTLAYLGFVYGPLSGIANTAGSIQQALASAARVRETFALAAEADDGTIAPPRFRGHLEFQHVSFAYDRRLVLHDVTFAAMPGEMIAIVGPSGSGKTTLVSLIPRFYDPTDGYILLEGQDIKSYRLRALREQIAIVLQEVFVLAGSVRENLRYGRLDADDDAIERAARAAHAHEFIMRLEHGYDTELAEAGAGLSGGERQRLSIARAFLKDAPILILDEPTAALDRMSEALVFDAIEQLRQGRTVFVIAHRLSTVRAANSILVMNQGEIVARGTHDELMASNALYRQLAAELNTAFRQ